ncbi:hypothetical protein ACUNF8_19270 [Serratia sp. IR-2025]
MMDNKLSELSKPVGFVSKQAQALLKSGDTASVRPLFDVQGSSPLYSQEYVSALDKVAQFWIGESAGWKKRAEDAEKRIAELERANQSQDDHINQQQDRIDSLEKKNGDLGRSLGAAEKRLATPVRKTSGSWSPLYTAPPAPAVVKLPTEFYSDEGVVVRLEEVMAALAVVGVQYERKGGAFRAAMLAQPVSGGYKLPDNVREALTLALQAMEFMGDTLNNIDAVCTEDVEFVTPAFTAVRGLLAAAPEGGNG